RCTVRHAYSHFRITLHVFEACPESGRIRAGAGCTMAQWVRVADLHACAMPITARKVVGAWVWDSGQGMVQG
ncbi:MAG: hypothetical protein O3C57_07050, partial [Verrucomicrobia bacterium]|nr:hypothetical protein [Verrucomicrobiota bacterium]